MWKIIKRLLFKNDPNYDLKYMCGLNKDKIGIYFAITVKILIQEI